jgi:hypothetical protein
MVNQPEKFKNTKLVLVEYSPLILTFYAPSSIKTAYYIFSGIRHELLFMKRNPTKYQREEGKHE